MRVLLCSLGHRYLSVLHANEEDIGTRHWRHSTSYHLCLHFNYILFLSAHAPLTDLIHVQWLIWLFHMFH